MLKKIPCGYAKKEIIFNEGGDPVDWKYLEVSEAFEEQLGFSLGTLKGKMNTETMPNPEALEDWLVAYRRASIHRTEEEFVSYIEPLKKWFKVHAYSPQEGQVVVFIQDATKHEENKQLYKNILSDIPDVVFITNCTGKVEYVSSNAAQVFGFSKTETFEWGSIQKVLEIDLKKLDGLNGLNESGEVLNVEKTIPTKWGRKTNFLINIRKVELLDHFLLFTCRELTEETATERKIEQNTKELSEVLSQEKERVRVSRDIHDRIAQLLVGTRLMLNHTLHKDVTLERIKELNFTVDNMLGDMIRESRLIINNFGTSIIEDGNLERAFVELAEKMKKIHYGEISVEWQGGTAAKNLLLGVHLFRIYQEALTNAIKYSGSDMIEIKVVNLSTFTMTISDHGNGFDTNDMNTGFGIQNMNQRAQQIGGDINIVSNKGVGTTVMFVLR